MKKIILIFLLLSSYLVSFSEIEQEDITKNPLREVTTYTTARIRQKAIVDLTVEELSRLFDKIVVFDKEEITKDIMQEYNLTEEMYKELYENGGLAFHLKFMYPQTITNRWM